MKGAAALGALGLTGGLGLSACGEAEAGFPPPRPRGLDAIQHHTLHDLRRFTGWLERFDERGFIGEMNWPNGLGRDFPDDQSKWNALGELWYSRADAAKLWVTAFCADERQVYGGFWLSVYRSSGERGPEGELARAMSVPEAQATVIEAHPSAPDYRRGVNVAAAVGWVRPEETTENGPPNSNRNPGVRGEDYWYPGLTPDPNTGRNTFEYLAERGVDVVRIPFRWERLQPHLGYRLDPTDLSELKDSVAAAGSAGLGVILSLQNYGGYWADVDGTVQKLRLGTPELSTARFKDIWVRLSGVFGQNESVVGYDLMNEPAGAGGIGKGGHDTEERQWEAITREVVDAIRGLDDDKWLMIPGYGGAGRWPENHPEPWISNDPYDRYMYTAHQYFDSFKGEGEGGGSYRASYADENRIFADAGW